jgi:gamma-glutamyltranspeptidase/glutathione hydrolase
MTVQRGTSVRAKNGICSAGAERVPEAAVEILTAGGNAFDSAAAALLMVGTGEQTFGLEVPIIYFDAVLGEIRVINGQGPAPALATFEYFRDSFPDGRIPWPDTTVHNAAVPGLMLACLTLLSKKGTLSFERAAAPMLRYLETGEGYQLRLGDTIGEMIDTEREAIERGGDRVDGLRAVRDHFYDGPVAGRIDRWMVENGGLIRRADMAEYARGWAPIEKTVSASYRGYTVHKCDTWTQGPYLLQCLNMLEGFDVSAMAHNGADHLHLLIEALKLGLADRDRYFADPDFERVPLGPLLSKEYADIRRRLIDPGSASHEVRPGDPERMKPLVETEAAPGGEPGRDRDTTTCIVADGDGNVVVATPSGWGDIGTDIGETGVRLSSRLMSFRSGPGFEDHPNVVAPGKRPATTLTPTLVTRDGRPVIGVSVAGGDMQDQSTLNILLNLIDFGLTPDRAVTEPRVATEHHVNWFFQTPPVLGVLSHETDHDPAVVDELRRRGHVMVAYQGAQTSPSVVVIDHEKGMLWGAGDPEAGRNVAGY